MAEVGDKRLEGRSVFVTGAGGFIGGHVVRRLVAAGAAVIAADMQPLAGLPSGARGVVCDVRDAAAVRAAVGERVDYGVHLAAKVGDWGPWGAFEAVNVRGTRHVLEALVAAGARQIVHVSSIAVMGFEPGFLADEAALPQVVGDAYSDTKAAGENVARELQRRGAPVVVVRPGDVYGPGCVPWVIRPIELLRRRQMILVDGGRGHFGHVFVDNLVEGMVAALLLPAAQGRCYILTDEDQHTTFGAYFKQLAEETGLPEPFLSVPRPVGLAIGWGLEVLGHQLGFAPPITRTAVRFVTRRGSYSIARARRELGYEPRIGLEEGLARVGAWYSTWRG